MHPCSPWRTSVSSSSFYLFPFFFSRTFFRLLLTQLDIETEHIRKKKNALGEYSIALAKRGHSDCWLRCARHNRSLANGVNCVLRAMRDEKDKVVSFFLLSNGFGLFFAFFFFCSKRATGGERVWNFAAFYHPVVHGSFLCRGRQVKSLFTA